VLERARAKKEQKRIKAEAKAFKARFRTRLKDS
jgi:hypothetical protein